MQQSFDVPESISSKAESFFGKVNISEGLKLLRLSRTSISFSKGGPESYFIVSGIVKGDRSYECKVVYKKRLEGTPEGPLTSNCDCHLWNNKYQCPHTSSLYLSFLLQKYYSEDGHVAAADSDRPPISINTSFGVNVDEYGTIIEGPHKLIGAPPAATYTSLQYLLHNKKIINFPIPEKMPGKLIIFVTSLELFNDETGSIEYFPSIRFQYQDENDEIFKEISVFENLYLFNWKTGLAYNLPNEVRALIQKFRYHGHNINVNDLIKIYQQINPKDQLRFIVDEKDFEKIEEKSLSYRLSLEPNEKRKLINMNFIFFDGEENIIETPEFLKAFTFLGGELGSFKRKKDAYEFVEVLCNSFKEEHDDYKKIVHGSSSRTKWLSLIDFVTNNERSIFYSGATKKKYVIENHIIIKILINLYDCFGEMLFRYGEYSKERKELSFQLSATTLFQNLSRFYNLLEPYGLNIYYDRNEISSWSSRIRFERRQSTTKWFDLELNIDQEDLDIIKKADLETGLVLTDKGLILLNKEQKDLLKFMKKYVQYEGKLEGEDDENDLGPKKFVLPFNRSRIFELFELKKLGIEGALTPEEEKLCERLSTMEEMPEYELPNGLDEVLRPYQKTGYNWLRFLYENHLGACLADDMGLGKTLQTITFISSIIDKIDRVLIVCPVSILLNWEKEFKKFSDLDVYIYHGGERKFPEDTKIILTSYGVMKREVEETFMDKHFELLILDEVQHLKNIRSLGAFAARRLDAGFRICLTGTPVENDLAEFYNILDLSIPGIWGDLQFFRTSSTKKSRLIAKKTASPFILRRTKDQVLTDLPPKQENNVYLSLSDDEQNHYENSLKNIKKKIVLSPTKKKYGEILRGLLQLRQLCLWQGNEKVVRLDTNKLHSTKIEFLMEQLEQIQEEGHQAIVFSQFTTYLDIIEKFLHEKHWKFSRIDGSQNVKRRQKEVDAFQAGETPIFLISLKAGGVGLNLTAASYVFVMDPWWNPAVEQQAIDRAHRIGQQNTLTVYRPIIKDSVEEKVLELQEMKKELFKDLLTDDEESLFTGKLSMKDFEHLFE